MFINIGGLSQIDRVNLNGNFTAQGAVITQEIVCEGQNISILPLNLKVH